MSGWVSPVPGSLTSRTCRYSLLGLLVTALLPEHPRDRVPGDQRVWVGVAQHPDARGQDLPVQVLGLVVTVSLLEHPRDFVPGGQCVRVGVAQHPLAHGQDLPEQLFGLLIAAPRTEESGSAIRGTGHVLSCTRMIGDLDKEVGNVRGQCLPQ